MSRAYLRVDPMLYERKVVDQGYPLPLFAAFVGVLCLAEHQPQRGVFRNERVCKALLGSAGRLVGELITRGDLVRRDGHLYVDGWDEWQEGDWKVGERVQMIRARHGDQADRSPGARRTANWRLRTAVFERDAYTCRYCGTGDYPREWLVLEHVDPNGPTDETNLVAACRPCNKLKGGRTPSQSGMTLPPTSRDTSRDVGGSTGRDASPLSDGDRLSVIDSGGVIAERTPPTPPPGRGTRSSGANPRAIAAALTRKAEEAEKARKYRRQQRYLAYASGRLTEAQRIDMDERDAPLDEIAPGAHPEYVS